VEAKVLPHLTYPVVVHLLVGPTLNSSFTLASILPVMAAANSILSQAGISLNVSSVLTHTFTTDALLNVDTPTVGFGEAATVTALTAAANAIDIYFTNKVLDSDGDDLNGLTILFSQQSSLFGRTPGILIGANGIGFGSGIRKAGLMPRTIAHEIGHYLLDTTGHAPNNQLWNLMLSGGIDNSDRKRDLTEQQADDIRKSNVTPTNTR
jgi:hypothetical protein